MDFLATGGAGNHSWNVVRSEADDILFKHAAECGAKVFDKTKVTAIEFDPQHELGNEHFKNAAASTSRPVSASWSRKEMGFLEQFGSSTSSMHQGGQVW